MGAVRHGGQPECCVTGSHRQTFRHEQVTSTYLRGEETGRWFLSCRPPNLAGAPLHRRGPLLRPWRAAGAPQLFPGAAVLPGVRIPLRPERGRSEGGISLRARRVPVTTAGQRQVEHFLLTWLIFSMQSKSKRSSRSFFSSLLLAHWGLYWIHILEHLGWKESFYQPFDSYF